jgi:pimeloyl-ACP methyl ester carboxylesterase
MFSRLCESNGAERLPFVLVHGLSMSSLYLAPTARRLAQRYRVYAPDLPGYGRSQHPARALDIDGLTAALRKWMDYMELGEVLMLGNSLGCQVIAAFVVQNPERVRRAVLTGPTMDPAIRRMPLLFAQAVRTILHEPLSFYPVLARDYFAAGVRETFQALAFMQQDPIQERLRQVSIPTLVVRGQHDWLASQVWAEQVARLLPDGRLGVIPGGGHVVNFDSPGRLVKMVEAFAEEEEEEEERVHG